MKKNFLLLLLMTLLPLAGWAQQVQELKDQQFYVVDWSAYDVVKVGAYDVTISTKLVSSEAFLRAPSVDPNAPSILRVMKGTTEIEGDFVPEAIYGVNGQIVEEIDEGGTYFMKVTFTDNGKDVTLFVPFQVGTPIDPEIVWNEATFQYSQQEDGFEYWYHKDYPTYDVWDWETKAQKDEAPNDENHYVYSIEPLVRGNQYASLFDSPFVGLVVPDNYEDTYHLGLKVNGKTKGFMRGVTLSGDPETENAQNYMFWTFAASGNVAANEADGTGGFLFANLMGGELAAWRFNYSTDVETGVTTIAQYDPETTAYTAAEYVEQTMPATSAWQAGELAASIGFYLVAPLDPFNLNVTVTYPSKAYSNSVLNPGLVVYVGETQIQPVSGDSDNGYTVTWYDENGNEAELIEKGTYIGVVTYNGKVAMVTFTITRAEQEVILNPAYVEKTYGDADPAPKFKQEGGQVFGDIEQEIMQYLVLKRSNDDPVATRENVGDHLYYIDFTPEYRAGECNYEITILQNHSILKIIPRPLSIQVTAETATKEYKKADPVFKYVVDEGLTGQLQFNDADKASGTPSAEDIITSITREEGEVVGGDGYKFTATSQNYDVTVTNNFVITPTTDVSGIKIQFAKEPNSTVYLDDAAYTYTGVAQEPAFKIIDTNADPDYELVGGTDYVIEGDNQPQYANHTDVTNAATVTVTLAGNYQGEVTGTFAIKPATLTVAAKSYTAEQAVYEYDIIGWVADETAENQEARNITEGPDAVTYFKAPTTPVVTKNGTPIEADVYELVVNTTGFEAKNYTFKAQNGLLALNGTTPITVKAMEFYKEYDGEDVTSEDLEDYILAYDADNDPIDDFNYDKLILGNGPIYEIAKAATGRKHKSAHGAGDATGANEGFYDITLRGATVTKDYTINWVGLEEGCEIGYREITLKAEDKTKVFGAAVPELTAIVLPGEVGEDEKIHGGLIGDDTPASIGLVNNGPNNTGYYVTLSSPYLYRNNTWRITGEHATTAGNEYPISIGFMSGNSDGVFGNYYVARENGKLTVTKAAVTIAAADATKQFGAADPEFTITVAPTNDGTPASVATVANMNGFWTIARTDKDAADGENVGAHKTLKVTLTTAGKNAQDFTITASTENGTLTIETAKLYVAAKGQWTYYGGSINLYDVMITMPANNEEGVKVLTWNKVSIDPDTQEPAALSDEEEAENNAIKAIGHLEVLPGKNQVGTNFDAFKFVVDDENYVIAPDEEVDGKTVLGFKNNTLLVYPLEVIPLDSVMLVEMDIDKPLWQVLEDHKGSTVTFIMPRRTMVPDDWYAWVLPFDVTPRELSKAWGYAGFTRLDTEKSKGKTVVFKQTTTQLLANEPFLAKVDERIEKTLTSEPTDIIMDQIRFENKKIPSKDADGNEIFYAKDGKPVNPSVGEAGNVNFVGLYSQKNGVDATQLYLARANGSKVYEFWPGGANSASVVLRNTNAYLQFTTAEAAAGARIFIQEADGTYTAINAVESDANEANAEGWYTVNGMKLNAAPAQRGTYIQNGKKVLVK